jgi:hypothetical protein
VQIVLDEVVLQIANKKKTIKLERCSLDETDDGWTDLTKFWFVNSLGERVYIRCTDRLIAQQACDTWCGKKNFYTIVCSKGESSKGAATVRCVATTKGQSVQRNKARILNG